MVFRPHSAILCAIVCSLVGLGCTDDEVLAERDACAGVTPGEVQEFAVGIGATEGISFAPDGRMFVSAGDEIDEVAVDGTWTRIVDLPGSIGLAWWGEALYAASSSSGLEDGQAGVFRVDPDLGKASLFGDGLPGANFLAVTPWDTLLVADDDATIFELDGAGVERVWSTAIPSPNGLAFNADGSELYVASTFTNPAPVWAVTVVDHEAGDVRAMKEYGSGAFPDGVALGVSNTLYVSLNVAGQIDRVSPAGADLTPLADGVAWTASLAFGEVAPWDRCAVYSTSLFGDSLYAVSTAEVGAVLRR